MSDSSCARQRARSARNNFHCLLFPISYQISRSHGKYTLQAVPRDPNVQTAVGVCAASMCGERVCTNKHEKTNQIREGLEERRWAGHDSVTRRKQGRLPS